MQTTNLGEVAIGTNKLKKSKIPLNRNIYGSCGFGEVNVHQLLEVDADEKTMLSNEVLLYLANVVSPTYGHVTQKFWNYFVAYSDLFKNYGALMSQTNVRRSAGVFVPQELPYMPKCLLLCAMLRGAHMSVYEVTVNSAGERIYTHPVADASNSSEIAQITTFWNNLSQRMGGYLRGPTLNRWGFSSLAIDCRALVDFGFDPNTQPGSWINHMWIELSNPSTLSVCEIENNNLLLGQEKGLDVEPVTIDGADFMIERTFSYNNQNYTYAFCFRLHAFGSRLFKVFKGSELQDDWTSSEKVYLAPLFAIYKAYFDSFGLLLYTNFENTALADLLSLYDEFNVNDFAFGMVSDYSQQTDPLLSRLADAFDEFLTDLGSMWVTDAQDFESAHTKTVGISPKIDEGNSGFAASFPSTPNSNYVINPPVGAAHVSIPNENDEGSPTTNNQHAFINNIFHGQLDSELLKRLYQITNRNTIAGKRIEELLRSQGLGKWMEHQKPRFIHYEEIPVDFSRVLSQADTLDVSKKQGALLGDRGGYGQGYNYGKKMFFHNDENGFVITLTAVVPDAGLTNCENVAYSLGKKLDFYHPDFDAMGNEITKIKQICGSMPIVCNGSSRHNVLEQGFGYIPRSAKFKVVQNILNGNFARHSRRDYFLTYCMDKLINVGDVVTNENEIKTVNNVRHRTITAFEAFPPSAFPLAGLAWRYPTRYPWLGLFTRIFSNVGDAIKRYKRGTIDVLSKMWEFCNNEDDPFFYLSTQRGCKQSPKLPITDSFETREDGNKGKIDYNVSKA